jgi:CHAT domain-containing protein/Tfp pilus assembly protein PilF
MRCCAVVSSAILFFGPSSLSLARSFSWVARSSQQDSRIAAAQQIFAEGQQLFGEGTAVSKHRAIEKFSEAAKLWHAAGDKRREAIALSFIGKIYDLLGQKVNALDYYTQTLSLVRTVLDRSSEAATLNNIGLIYDSLGEKQKALEYYNSALPILESLGDRRVQAITLVNVGLVHDSLGEKQKALKFYQEALPLLRAVHDRADEAVTLNNLGYLYDSIGEQQKALAYFERALTILHEIGDRRVEAITLNNIGYVYNGLDDKQKALEYYNRALPVLRSVGDRRMEAVTLNNIGLAQKAIGDTKKALAFFNEALELRHAVSDRPGEAITLSDIGSVYILLGDAQKALDLYRQALQLSRAVEDRSTEASVLHRIAMVKRDRGELTEARANLEDALVIVEHLRTRIAGQELRSSYFASVHQFFESYIDVLMRLYRLDPAGGYDALALQAAERARARSLLDSLLEARAKIRQGIAPELLERERTLRRKLDATAEQQARLFSSDHTDEQAAALKHETETLLIQYQEIEVEIRTNSPRFAALMQPSPLSLTEIQQQVLDSNTLLLEYALGDERSYLWAVTPSSVKTFELPSRAEVEAATRRVYELLTARNKHIKFEKLDEQRTRIAQADADFTSESADLSQMLLGPVASDLGKKRLLIVSDGGLTYLPFAALPAPLNTEARNVKPSDSRPQAPNSRFPLIVEHEIVSLPSVSALSVLRRELRGRAPAAKTLAVVADPVFERDDERVNGVKVRPKSNAGQKRSIDVSRTSGLARADSFRPAPQVDLDEVAQIHRLPFTRREAEQILALVPKADRFAALDFDASRATATNPALGQYRYVHFATHGFLDAAHPELSGIVLSLVNRQGAEQDGFLWAHEVYNLRLPVEMMVLSGCRTGLGKEIKGEGLVGLTRGFMYAGAARVLVSLWDIDDEASAELMADLYKAILKEHRAPAAALRIAQLKVLNDRRWHAPYYWAAFVLQGEPR